MNGEAPRAGAVREGFIETPDGRLFYRIAGPDAPGIPLLALHGGPGVPHDYLEPLAALADERPVVFYDQLGCGLSDRPDDLSLYTLPRYVAELGLVRQTLGLTRLHLLGQSFGTMLAVDYLLEKGLTGVCSLILSAPCLDARRFVADQRAYLRGMPAELRETIEAKEASGDFASSEYQEAMMAYYRKHVCLLAPWPDCMNRALEQMGHPVYEHMWGPSEFTMTGSLADYDRTGDLARLTVPTFFTCGRQDEATPETTAYYQSKLPGARLLVLEEASHVHHLEQPALFLESLRRFLRDAETGA